eukprot:7722260-Pyramimonas_sp.AAC.1
MDTATSSGASQKRQHEDVAPGLSTSMEQPAYRPYAGPSLDFKTDTMQNPSGTVISEIDLTKEMSRIINEDNKQESSAIDLTKEMSRILEEDDHQVAPTDIDNQDVPAVDGDQTPLPGVGPQDWDHLQALPGVAPIPIELPVQVELPERHDDPTPIQDMFSSRRTTEGAMNLTDEEAGIINTTRSSYLMDR